MSTRGSGRVTVVAVAGDLDIGSSAQLRHHLLTSLRPDAPGLVLDLTDLTFIDCAGLGVLIAAHNVAETLGGWLRIACPPPLARRLIDLGDLGDVLHLTSTVEEAMDIDPAGPRRTFAPL